MKIEIQAATRLKAANENVFVKMTDFIQKALKVLPDKSSKRQRCTFLLENDSGIVRLILTQQTEDGPLNVEGKVFIGTWITMFVFEKNSYPSLISELKRKVTNVLIMAKKNKDKVFEEGKPEDVRKLLNALKRLVE